MGSLFLFLLGLAVGSFLNVVIDRLPRRESLFYPPSHCEECQHPLAPKDLVPLFSYLFLKGRCRYCRAPIPIRLFLVELSCGILFLLMGLYYGWGLKLLPPLLFVALFIPIFVIDLEKGIIPDELVFSLIILGLVLSFLGPGIMMALLGGAIGFLVLFLPYILWQGGMGGGDVKLGAGLGLALGFPYILLALFLSFLSGALIGGLLIALKKKGRKDPIPFAPFLLPSALLSLIYGQNLLSWYISIVKF